MSGRSLQEESLSNPENDRRIADASRALRHVFVRDLVLQASIGAYAHEQAAPQPVRINIELGVEDDGALPMSRAPVGKDELSRVVDYGRIAASVRAIVGAGHVRLVETLAERIAEAAFADARVRQVRVRVEKLAALADAASVGVEIERWRPPR
jgi:dihydroneopterin aldolase